MKNPLEEDISIIPSFPENIHLEIDKELEEILRKQAARIKVVGVGGGGGNAVNHMFRQGITGVDFIVCNTDIKALESSQATVLSFEQQRHRGR